MLYVHAGDGAEQVAACEAATKSLGKLLIRFYVAVQILYRIQIFQIRPKFKFFKLQQPVQTGPAKGENREYPF